MIDKKLEKSARRMKDDDLLRTFKMEMMIFATKTLGDASKEELEKTETALNTYEAEIYKRMHYEGD